MSSLDELDRQIQ